MTDALVNSHLQHQKMIYFHKAQLSEKHLNTSDSDDDTAEDPGWGDATGSYHNHGDVFCNNQEPPVFGYLTTPTDRYDPQTKDRHITDILKDSYEKSTNGTYVDFPYVSERPVNEYDLTSKLFFKAFPWLFPGGHGESKKPLMTGCTASFTLKMDVLLLTKCGDSLLSIMPSGRKIQSQVHTLSMGSLRMDHKQLMSFNNKSRREITIGSTD